MCRAAQKVAARWLHLALTPALLAWKNLNSQSKRVKGAAQKVVLRWLKSALVVVMDVQAPRIHSAQDHIPLAEADFDPCDASMGRSLEGKTRPVGP